MNVYVAGPMSGIRKNNFDAFYQAAERLRAKGLFVVTPAEMNVALGITQDDGEYSVSGINDYAVAMPHDIDAIYYVDALYMLKGWERSPGAKVEHALAVLLGKKIVYQEGTFNAAN